MKNIQETEQKKSGDFTVKKQPSGKPFTKDDPRINREGRPVGSRNFATDFDEVVEEIAKINKITASEARKILLRKAYAEAKNGQFPYHKDIMDRYYGKAQEFIDLTSKGRPIPILNVSENNSDSKDNEDDKTD